jgi:hypothetical protein
MSARGLVASRLFFVAIFTVLAGLTPVAAAPAAAATCADWNGDGLVTAQDALGILRGAIGSEGCEVYRCDVDGNGSVSSSDALRALGIAVGQSIAADCPVDPDECLTDMEFFFERIWTPILTDCVTCHNRNGIASQTDHVLLDETEDGYLEYDFNTWKNFASIVDGKIGAELLLTKPQGIDHAGGQRLGITPQSVHYANIVELLARFDEPVTDCGTEYDYWNNVSFLSNLEVLDKAAVLFAGRRPSSSEQERVAAGDLDDLEKTIRGMMTGPSFESFVMEGANDHLLTDKYLIRQSNAFGVLKGEYQYPDLYKRVRLVEAIYGNEMGDEAYYMTNRALAREPLELFAYIARNERPYTEVVTADYMVVNPWSAPVYQTKTDIHSDWDENNWRAGHNNGYRIGGYPHAGVLTSPMFLARFPSTATNRNRARARWVYQFFLGVDIEALSPRLVDPAELDDEDNPTMNNPNCTVCHSVHDPVAATFQNFGDDGLFLENDTDSLPWSYKRTDLYENGDRWYRDMRAPGFNGSVMPESETDASLPWLGAQIAADPRFARGAVEFWYESMFGRKSLARPTDPSTSDYRARLAAWVAEDTIFDDIAAKFRDGSAGTARHGAYNLKDLLVELTISPLFTADGAAGAGGARATELAEVGFSKLLTPEQLDRKFTGLTGRVWARPSSPDEPDLLGRYRLFYGGIDSSGIVERADELNALMSTVPQRMSLEMACPLAVADFSETVGRRTLFPFVEPSDVPGDPASDLAIRSNVVWLHYWLLGEYLSDDDPEVDRTVGLFEQIWAMRTAAGKSTNLRWGGGRCELDFSGGDYIEEDPDQTIRAWIAVRAYLLNDYRFIYE